MLDYGGTNARHIGKRQFQFVELIDFLDATGELLNGKHKYCVELRLVDLDAITEDQINSAVSYVGMDRAGSPTDSMLADACNEYGCHAPLGSWSGNNAHKLLRLAYAEANRLANDEALETALNKPVNAIGSTAQEFMRGDFASAIQRGCESGSPDARIMAKMHGATQQAIDDARPNDFLPYVFGYMAGLNGGSKETDPDTAPEYFRGYERGANVKSGKAPAPSWIMQTT